MNKRKPRVMSERQRDERLLEALRMNDAGASDAAICEALGFANVNSVQTQRAKVYGDLRRSEAA